MTPAQVLTDIRDQLYETSANFWSDSSCYNYMSNAEQIIADALNCYVKTDSSTTTTASLQEYATPNDCSAIIRLTYDSYTLKLIDLREKDSLRFNTYGNTDNTGKPEYYYEFGSVIGLYPIPTETKTLKFFYSAVPARITSASTAFSIPSMFHPYIADYCLFRLYIKDQDDVRSAAHKRLWDEGLKEMNRKWSSSQFKNRILKVKSYEDFFETDIGII
jgi:hypothetical protein